MFIATVRGEYKSTDPSKSIKGFDFSTFKTFVQIMFQSAGLIKSTIVLKD